MNEDDGASIHPLNPVLGNLIRSLWEVTDELKEIKAILYSGLDSVSKNTYKSVGTKTQWVQDTKPSFLGAA